MSDTRNHVLTFFANGIGDHFMTTPTLRAILRSDHRHTLIWIPGVRGAFFADLRNCDYRDFQFYVRNGKKRVDFGNSLKDIGSVDTMICLQPWHTVDVQNLIQTIKPRKTVGFHNEFDIKIHASPQQHYVDKMFRVATWLNPAASLQDFCAPIVPSNWRREAESVLATVPTGTRILACHADTKTSKMWGAEKFAWVLKEFLRHHEDFIVVAVGYDNLQIRRSLQSNRLIAIDNLPLTTNLGLLAAADFFFGVDSCMLHAADFLRIPGLALFGPSPDHPEGSNNFGFRFGPHIHVTGHGLMQDIDAEEVLFGLNLLLQTDRSPA